MFLFHENSVIGELSQTEDESPFFSAVFEAGKISCPALEYLEYSRIELEMEPESKEHLVFLREREKLFPESVFGKNWKIGNSPEDAQEIHYPQLAEKELLWTVL